MNALIKSNSLIKEILKDRYKSLALIIGLMILTGIVQATSVLGLMPIVGAPLPIMSYGGSSMLAIMFGLGVAMSCKVHKDIPVN